MAQTARLELEADSSQITSATRQLKNLQTQGSATEKTTGKMTASANTATKAMGGMGRSAGQVGIQVQQLVGQVQGGQNVFQAFSAQAADIGIVMGAPLLGVLAAFGGAIAGTLLPSLFNAESATNALDTAMELLNETAKESDGITSYTDQIKQLAAESEKAARLLIASAELASRQAGQAAADAISESFNDSFDVTFLDSSFEALKSIAGTSAAVGYSISQDFEELGEQFGLTGIEARKAGSNVLIALREMEQAVNSGAVDSSEKIVAFQETLADLANNATGDTRTKILTFVSSINEYTTSAQKAAEMNKFFNDSLSSEKLDANVKSGEELGLSAEDIADSISRLTDSLTAQKVALEQGELQGQLYAAAQATGADSVNDLDSGVKQLIIDIHAAKDAKVAEAQATRDLIAAEREQANAQKAFDNVSSSIEADQGGAVGKIEQEYQQRLEIITAYEQSIGTEAGSLEAERLAALQVFEKKKTDVLKSELEQRKQLESAANNEALGAAATVFGNLADIAKEGGEDSFQSYKNLASAQAAINAALAITNVLGSPFTAINPIAGAALATSIGALATVQIGKIQSQEYQGYEQGGYTGNYGTKEVAGVVHGQEFVLNAAATKKNRPVLEAMNQGKDISGTGGGQQVTNQDTVNVNVVSASNEQVVQQIMQNMDLIYNGISRAKRARGQTF